VAALAQYAVLEVTEVQVTPDRCPVVFSTELAEQVPPVWPPSADRA
jgi:hypothetical protein